MVVHRIDDKDDYKSWLTKAGSKLVVVHLCVNWCGPSKLISPILEEMSHQLRDKVVFLEVDVEDNEDIAADEKVTVMPTFIFYKQKLKVYQLTDADENKIKDVIQTHT